MQVLSIDILHTKCSSELEQTVLYRDMLRKMFSAAPLTDREKDLIHKKFCERMTLKQVALEEGISPERVRQILAKASRKLRYQASKLTIAERDRLRGKD